jgi:hypothetical protein
MARKGKKGNGLVVKTSFNNLDLVFKDLEEKRLAKLQLFVTDEVVRRLPAYIPKKEGHLRSTVARDGRYGVRVTARHARVQFFGVAKSGRPFDYDLAEGGPKAGSHWDRRLAADEGPAIVAAAQRYVDGGCR